MMEPVDIPDYIDALPQFLLWELDEVMPVFLMVYGAMFTRQLLPLLLALLLSYAFVKAFRKVKGRFLDGFLLHTLYRQGLLDLNKCFGNGLIVEYVE